MSPGLGATRRSIRPDHSSYWSAEWPVRTDRKIQTTWGSELIDASYCRRPSPAVSLALRRVRMYLDHMTPLDRYTHGHHESVLRSHTWRTAQNSAGFLLPHLKSGDSLLDVGCGPGTITMDLAALVAAGPVVGLDRSKEVIEQAREAAEARALSNLSFEVGDVYELEFEDSSFDVVYAHQVLQHLSEPTRALVEMRRVLRVGGWLAVRDGDYGAFSWSPPSEGLDRWMELYHDITREKGAEANA